jgi:diamine N-acetyltransferase
VADYEVSAIRTSVSSSQEVGNTVTEAGCGGWRRDDLGAGVGRSGLRLEEVSEETVAAACRLAVRPDQESLVAPVAWSLAEAFVHADAAWPRLIFDDDQLVGFVMGGFEPKDPPIICAVWRLNISGAHQGRGYGRFAVEAVIAEARRRGGRRLTVRWHPVKQGPEKFYLRLGFRPTGRVIDGEVEAALFLCDEGAG